MSTPKIRFKGFEDDWEQRKLGDISDVRDGTHASPKYQVTGHPFVTSKNVKNGFINYDDIQYISDEDFEEINKRSKVDVNDILMGMIGTIGNMALIRTEPNFAIKNVALIKDTKQVNYLYLYHFLHSPYIEKQLSSGMDGGTQKFVALGNVRNLTILFPSEEEQRKVGNHFEQLDHLITLHQRKCDETKELKKFMLQKMFPKNGEKNPEIRFDGFTDDWEQRKFSDITFPAGEKNKDNLPLESYSITNEHGFVPQDEKFENGGTMREADKRMYYIVSPNSFAYNPARINVGSIGYQNIGKNVIVSSLYEVFKTSEDVDDRLLWHWFKSPDFQKLIMQLQEGGVRLYFYYDKLCMGEVSLPSLEEQRKIGKLFDTLDNLITLHQRKCEKLKELKKFMLQNMVV